MKWGKITFLNAATSHTACNIGDIAQIFAVELLYKEMHIHPDDIIEIPLYEIGTYKGEHVILPMAGYYLYNKEFPLFPTSKNITPIFLSVYCTSKQYIRKKDFWEKYKPIGCRDEKTMQIMCKEGYDAYLLGCITAIFPKRNFVPNTPHTFLVDVYPKAINYIPKKIMDSAEYVTHDIPIDKSMPKEQTIKYMYEKAKVIYSRYQKEATLVVTSRLHCAVPCIAMGIPTIVVKNGFDERFGWLDKLIHLYTPDEFEKIDWNPQPINYESHKKLLIENAIAMLNRSASTDNLKKIQSFYMNRKRKKLHTPFLVAGYTWLAQYLPGPAGFLREKVFRKFSILSNQK